MGNVNNGQDDGGGEFEDDPILEPDGSADPDLDEPLEGDDDQPGDGDPEPPKEGDDEAEKARKAAEDEEKEFLDGIQMVNGVIPKKAFLKRLKGLKEKLLKEREEALAAYKPFDEKKDHYAHWDQNHETYRRQAEFVEKLRPVLTQDPWLQSWLQKRMAGEAPNYADLAQVLKPFIAPFWDGIQMVEPDPQEAVAQELQRLKEQVARVEQERVAQRQEMLEKQKTQENMSAFQRQEKAVWKDFPEFNNKTYRDLMLARAESIQKDMDERGKGEVVDLSQVGREIFTALRQQAKAEREKRLQAKGLSRKAAAEPPGRSPHTPVPSGKPVKDEKAAFHALIESIAPGPLVD